MEALGIDGKLLIAQIVNFAIFFLIFKKFVAKPLMAYIKKQQDEEHKRHSLSQELETAKTQLEEKQKEMISKAKGETKIMLDDAKEYAENIKRDMLDQAKKQASEIVDSGKVMLEQEKQTAQAELKKYISEKAKVAVEKGLSSYLTNDARKEVTKNIIATLS